MVMFILCVVVPQRVAHSVTNLLLVQLLVVQEVVRVLKVKRVSHLIVLGRIQVLVQARGLIAATVALVHP